MNTADTMTTEEPKTEADKVARLFSDDGQCWEIKTWFDIRITLDDVLMARSQRMSKLDGNGGLLYHFEDDSGIVVLDSGWCTLEDFLKQGGSI